MSADQSGGADPGLPSQWRTSLSSGAWAVADQACYSVANFVLHVLLARWLIEGAYGAFAVAFTVFALAGTIYAAVVIEPMLVFGPGRYRGCLRRYYSRLGQMHALVSVGCGLLLIAGSGLLLALGEEAAGKPLLAFGLAAPVLLLLWLARRTVYVVDRPQLAACGSAVYLGVMLGGMALLQRQEALDPISAIGLMTVGCGVASVTILVGLAIVLRRRAPGGAATADPSLRTVLKVHADYGRWAVGTGLLTWLPGHIYYLVLPIWYGYESTGALRAMMNLYLPMLHAVVALGVLAIPRFVRWRESDGFVDSIVRVAAWPVLAALSYAVLVSSFRTPVVDWLYSGRYVEYADLAWLLALIPAAEAAAAFFGAGLRALERPDRVLFAYLGGSTFTISAGLLLAYVFGVPGASVAWSAGLCLTAALLLRWLRRSNDAEESWA